MSKSIKLALIGAGVVGSAVAELIKNNGFLFAQRIGAPVEIVAVAVRDTSKERFGLDAAIITGDAASIVNHPDIDIVIEVMGGDSTALDLSLAAINNGKHLVTANKHLLALHGEKLYEAVENKGVALGFEAAVAGAIPIIHTLRGAFAANHISSIYGIVNGTANYILSRMADEGAAYEEVLKDAQSLGYAEADPTFDVEGIDAAHKIAILASLAFQTPVDFSDVAIEGISAIAPEELLMAKEFGYVIKLLAIAEQKGDEIGVRVHPAMVSLTRPIAKVNGAFNAVEIECGEADQNLLVGPGAGGGPTASAILGDVCDIGRAILAGSAGKSYPMNVPVAGRKKLSVMPADELSSPWYLRFTTPDRPGVLAQLSGALGDNNISIATMVQRGNGSAEGVHVVMITHTARRADLDKALATIDATDLCASPTVLMQIEGAATP